MTAPSVMPKRAPHRDIKAPIKGADRPCTSTKSEKPVPSIVAFMPSDVSCNMSGLIIVAEARMMPDEQK